MFAYWKQEVRQFLIDNGKALLEEYHLDGLRYDQVTVIDEHGGWSFCQDLTDTLRFLKPAAVQIAEYWGGERWRACRRPDGMGFDVGYSDTLRGGVRAAIAAASGGSARRKSGSRARCSGSDTQESSRWTVFQCIENHDLLDFNHGTTGSRASPRWPTQATRAPGTPAAAPRWRPACC